MTKEDLNDRLQKMKIELSHKSKQPKRTQYGNHEIEVAKLTGKVCELQYLLSIWPDGMTVPNIIEQ